MDSEWGDKLWRFGKSGSRYVKNYLLSLLNSHPEFLPSL